MIKKIRFSLLTIALLTLLGCSSAPTVEPIVAPSLPPVNTETIRALNQLTELKEEMKHLRNLIEEMQFNDESGKRQQNRLMESLTQRLFLVEQAQQQVGTQGIDSSQALNDSSELLNNGDVVVDIERDSELPAGIDTVTPNGVSDSILPAPAIGATSSTVTLSEQQAYDNAFELLKQSLYEDAINEFRLLADTWPQGGLADDAYYWMSEARYVNRQFENALTGFRTVVTRYPNSPRVPEALLKIGYIQYDVGSYEDAAETFRNILAQFPGHQVAVSAKTRLRRVENTIQ